MIIMDDDESRPKNLKAVVAYLMYRLSIFFQVQRKHHKNNWVTLTELRGRDSNPRPP
jgi:hypothetical protein